MADDSLRKLKVQCAKNRCAGHLQYLSRFRSRSQASPAVLFVVDALKIALESLDNILDRLNSDPNADLFTTDETEQKVHYFSGILLHISQLLSLIEDAGTDVVPGELIIPLENEIKRHFPNAKIIVVASSELNYSIVDLSPFLKQLLSVLDKDEDTNLVPDQIFRISIPKVEFDQALLHCVLAHEIGHPLYKHFNIESNILPIEIEDGTISQLYNKLRAETSEASGNPQMELPFNELFFKELVTTRVNTIIPLWIEELSSDILGLLLWGPAYVLSMLHFTSSVFLLNSASESHPPTRLRLRFLLDTMEKVFPIQIALPSTRELLENWKTIVNQGSIEVGMFEKLALSTIDRPEVRSRLETQVFAAIADNIRYTPDDYKSEVSELCQLIDSLIPPCELVEQSDFSYPTIQGILNAGWECYLGGLRKYRDCYPAGTFRSEYDVYARFNDFLLKSLELNQVGTSWKGMKNDSLGRENTRTSS